MNIVEIIREEFELINCTKLCALTIYAQKSDKEM